MNIELIIIYIIDVSIRLTFIAYLNSKLFTANNVLNLEKDELNCSYGKQISPTVLSAYPLNTPLNTSSINNTDLITVIFQEQLVINLAIILSNTKIHSSTLPNMY